MRLQTSSSVFNQYRDKSPTSLPFMFSRGKVLTFLLRPQSVAFGPSVCLVFILDRLLSLSRSESSSLEQGENKVPRGMREWEKDWKLEEDISGIRREKDSRARAKPPQSRGMGMIFIFPSIFFHSFSPEEKKSRRAKPGKRRAPQIGNSFPRSFVVACILQRDRVSSESQSLI